MNIIMRTIGTLFLFAIFMTMLAILLTNLSIGAETSSNAAITSPGYPIPETPTAELATPSLVPIITEIPFPTSTPFPTVYPTSVSKPEGESVIYAEFRPEEIHIWAVSVDDTTRRSILKTIKKSTRGGYRFSLSPDKTKLAYTMFSEESNPNDPFQAELWIANLSNESLSKVIEFVDIGRYRSYPVWSPNGEYLSVMKRQTFAEYYVDIISVIHVKTGKETIAIESKISNMQEAAKQSVYILGWDTDNNNLYYQKGISEDVNLWSVDISTLKTREVNKITDAGRPRCYDLSFDKKTLLCSVDVVFSEQEPKRSIHLVPTSGESITIVDAEITSDPIWAQNALKFSFASGNKVITINEFSKQETYNISESSMIEPIAWSTSGEWLALYRSPETKGNLIIVNQSTAKELNISSAEGSEFIGWMP